MTHKQDLSEDIMAEWYKLSAYGSEGCAFESCWVHVIFICIFACFAFLGC